MTATSCAACGGRLTRRAYVHVTKLAGFTVTDGSGQALRCNDCDGVQVTSAELAAYERRAALRILATAKRPVSGAVLKFARKALGLKQKQLAVLLDSNEQQISRWENEKAVDRRLRLAFAGLLALAGDGVGIDQIAATPGHELSIPLA